MRPIGRTSRAGILLGCSICGILTGTVRAESAPQASPVEVREIVRQLPSGPVRGWVAVVDLSDPRVSVHVTGKLDREQVERERARVRAAAAATRAAAGEATTSPATQSALDEKSEAVLIATDVWARETGMTLAVNANFFAWLKGGGSDVLGMSVSDGTVVSPAREWKGVVDPAVVFVKAPGGGLMARIVGPGQPAVAEKDIEDAVAGIGGGEGDATPGTLLVQAGKNLGETARVAWNVRHPRTAIGVDATGRKAVVVVVDGRQKWWSIGMTLPELATLMIELGAHDAVNLDGGGSSAFVFRPASGDAITNRPSDGVKSEADKGRFRPVANHLGFRVASDDGAGRGVR